MLLVVYNVFNDAMILISCIALMCIFFIIVMSQNFDGEAYIKDMGTKGEGLLALC